MRFADGAGVNSNQFARIGIKDWYFLDTAGKNGYNTLAGNERRISKILSKAVAGFHYRVDIDIERGTVKQVKKAEIVKTCTENQT